jgi:hypothetical protein
MQSSCTKGHRAGGLNRAQLWSGSEQRGGFMVCLLWQYYRWLCEEVQLTLAVEAKATF